MGKSSVHEENIAYFLEKQRIGDLTVYLSRRSEIMWMLGLTVTSAIVLIGVVGIMPTNSMVSRGLIAISVFLDIALGLLYWFLLARFEKKIRNAIQKAEEVLI